VFHLLLVPVAGIGNDHARLLCDARRLKLAQGRVDHRAKVPEV
jgi:hypothetical protein